MYISGIVRRFNSKCREPKTNRMESPSSSLEEQHGDEEEEEEEEDETILSRQTSVSLVPFVGQRFVSQEAAYEFYCGFAKQRGFSIRRHRTRGKDGVGRGITRRDFTCHRAGFPQTKPTYHHDFAGSRLQIKSQRNRKSTRCGCQAYMRIVKRSTEPDHVPEWRVTGFGDSHNHEMLPRPSGETQHRLLVPCSDRCAVSAEDKARICVFAKAGMSVRQMLRLMELEKGVKLGCLPFTEVDVRNLLQSFRTVKKDSDPIDLVAMCKAMKDEDHNFKYDFKIDGCNRLECIAWSYATSLRSYRSFGDAVVFDTTHRLEGHDMLLGVFLGLDNHGQPCFFGCVLLRHENMHSFSWALKAFLEFVDGKAPQSISTDHNTWLKEAIANEMPQTKHAFCVWHIVAKFSNWFSVPLGPRYDEWRSEFHRLHGLDSPEEFDRGWTDMINEFGFHVNSHIISLYALRSFWAFAFLKQFFFAGMTSTFHAESIGAFIQRIFSAQSQLDRFVHHLSDIVESKDRPGPKYPKVCLKTGSPIESHAAAVLTPYAFTKLQEEIVLAPQYASVLSDDGCFQVRHHSEMERECQVAWVPCEEHIRCSCGQFEFWGIPCRHVIRVLSTNNCFHIPLQYLPPRWRLQDSSSSSSTAVGPAQKLQLLESMASSLVAESLDTDQRLDSALHHLSAALARAKELPRSQYNNININNNNNSDSLILEEDSDGIVRFSVDSLSSPGSKRRLESQRKRPRICFEPDCHLIAGEDVLGYL